MSDRSVRFVVACVATALSFVGCKKDAAEGAAGGGADPTPSSTPSSAAPAAEEAPAGDAFEGLIQVSISNPRKPAPETLTFETKGEKTRMDLPSDKGRKEGSGYMIFDASQKKGVVVMDEKKMVMTLDTSKVTPPADGKPASPPKVTKTGKMETIAGYPCENWEIEKGGGKTSACMAKNIPFFMMNMGARGSGPAWVDDLIDRKMFPLRLIEHDASGAETSRFEATKIEKRPVDDARFAIPAGYQTIDMGAMMAAFGVPGAASAGGPPGSMPPGFTLPPGVKLPPSVRHPPPGGRMPPGAASAH